MTELILLDLDDTIFDFHRAEAIALSATLTDLGVEPTDATVRRYSEINALQWEKLERGELTRNEVLVGRYEILFRELGIPSPRTLAETAWKKYEANLSARHEFVEGAEDLLRTLCARGYRLCAVSNGTLTVQKRRIAESGISRYFEKIFISQEVGFEKPSKEFFDVCAAGIPGYRRENALIVGDSLTSDILGGIRAGIHTCWFNPKGKPPREDIPADYEIRTLPELPELLKTI